jgi:hypothetical protein
MSILFRGSRPIIAFDVNNPDHRKWYAEFVKYRTWGRCPVRFMAEALDQDLVSYINDKMLHYYIEQEFEIGKTKNSGTRRSKPKPKSTSGVVRPKYTLQTKSGKEQAPVSTQTKTSGEKL